MPNTTETAHSAECLTFRAKAKEYAREMAMSVDADVLIELMNTCVDSCPRNGIDKK